MLANFSNNENRFPRKRKWSEVSGLQRLAGILLIICGVLMPIVNEGDATASVLLLPLGIYLLLTKEEVIQL